MPRTTCRAAVFVEAGKPLEIRRFELPEIMEPGSALCKVTMSTICGSDLHTISGRRVEPAPSILGHEIIGEIAALGHGLDHDSFGEELRVGDRVSWSIMASCGQCFYCKLDLPQKCEHLRKYGHLCCDNPPHLTGGYAEYIYLFPGTAIFKVPDSIPDEIATPANCALSTVVNAAETISINRRESVLIQGAGLLGLNLIALASEAGARNVIVTDISEGRLKLASNFGAHCCLDVKQSSSEDVLSEINRRTDGHGVDVALEVCGEKNVITQAVDALRIGGRYLIAGMVMPGSYLGLDGNQVTRKCLTIKGIHNYKPEHLGVALQFLETHWQKYPFDRLVGAEYPLDEINKAISAAASGEHVRVALA